jgi:hypothetical protein
MRLKTTRRQIGRPRNTQPGIIQRRIALPKKLPIVRRRPSLCRRTVLMKIPRRKVMRRSPLQRPVHMRGMRLQRGKAHLAPKSLVPPTRIQQMKCGLKTALALRRRPTRTRPEKVRLKKATVLPGRKNRLHLPSARAHLPSMRPPLPRTSIRNVRQFRA